MADKKRKDAEPEQDTEQDGSQQEQMDEQEEGEQGPSNPRGPGKSDVTGTNKKKQGGAETERSHPG